MKIFIAEDNEKLNFFISDTFEKMGYEVVTSIGDNEEKVFDIIEDFFDLYIIDINLPSINGLEIVKKIKLKRKNAKIFIISGDDKIETIIKAYDLGCDDYIKKPFDLREIIAKIKITFEKKLNKDLKLRDDCYYNQSKKIFYHNNQAIILTRKEILLLDLLVSRIGEIVPNEVIEEAVWGKEFANGHVRQLVSKLKRTIPCGELIKNYSSVGYGIL
ncbi:MAG: response regulator transcription factor [Campylobacterota bacterium]|nr:response regulator transcription factor [Campylobacterota bacterium]